MAARAIICQARDTNGDIVSGAKLNVYEAGTTTARTIYTASDLGTSTTNPATAASDGLVIVWIDDSAGDFKVVLTNAAGSVTLFSKDNIDPTQGPFLVYPLSGADQETNTDDSPTFAGLTLTGDLDMSGNDIILDADNDTKIVVNGDDSVSVLVGGVEVLKLDGAAADKLILDGVSFSPTGATIGQALGFPNSVNTLEPYTPAGGGDMLRAANETVTGDHNHTGNLQKDGVAVVNLSASQTLTNKTLTSPIVNGTPDFSGATISTASRQAFGVYRRNRVYTAEEIGISEDDAGTGAANLTAFHDWLDTLGSNGGELQFGGRFIYFAGAPVLDKSGVSLLGAGSGATSFVQLTDNTSGLIVQPETLGSGSQIQNITIQNIGFTTDGGTFTSGNAIEWRRVLRGRMVNVGFGGWSNGLLISGGQSCQFTNINGRGNSNQSREAASYLVRVQRQALDAGNEEAYVHHIANLMLEGRHAAYGIDVEFADGLQFSNVYCNAAGTANFNIHPQGGDRVYGLEVSDMYLDCEFASDTSARSLYGIRMQTTSTGSITTPKFKNLSCYLSTEAGLAVEGGCNINDLIVDGVFSSHQKDAIRLSSRVPLRGAPTMRFNQRDFNFERGNSIKGGTFGNSRQPFVTDRSGSDGTVASASDFTITKSESVASNERLWVPVVSNPQQIDAQISFTVAANETNDKTLSQRFSVYYDGTSFDIKRLWTHGGGSPFVIASRTGLSIREVSITTGGSGYAVGDVLTVSGGSQPSTDAPDAAIFVEAVDGSGAITAARVDDPGYYSTTPSAPMSVTGGSGSGATFGRTEQTQLSFVAFTGQALDVRAVMQVKGEVVI